MNDINVNGTKIFCINANIVRKLKAQRQTAHLLLNRRIQNKKNIEDFSQLDTLHPAIKPFMCLAQLFGIMPLHNMLHNNPNCVEFRFWTPGMFFTMFFLCFGGAKVMHHLYGLLQNGIESRNLFGIVFYTLNWSTCINFVAIARRWPALLRHWTDVDLIMLYPPYKPMHRKLRHKLVWLVICFSIPALVEHCLYHVSQYYNYRMETLMCHLNVTQINIRQYVVDYQYKDIFQLLPYNIPFTILAFYLDGTFTFIWNYNDLFIMMISVALTIRFQQFANRVLALVGRFVPDALWHDIRQDHIELCELIEHVDENFSSIIMISSLNTMYFICNQLLHIFTKLNYPINYIYFWYSLFFLLGRATAVFLYASKIHDASRLPLQVLYMVPNENWSEEVQRFMTQLTAETIGLSGHRLYYVTRKSFFGLATTIVTYVLMMLQLTAYSSQNAVPVPKLCA